MDTDNQPTRRRYPLVKELFERYPVTVETVEAVAEETGYEFNTIRSGIRGTSVMQRLVFDALAAANSARYPEADPAAVKAARGQTSTMMRRRHPKSPAKLTDNGQQPAPAREPEVDLLAGLFDDPPTPPRPERALPPPPPFDETHTAGILRLAIDKAARFLSEEEIIRLIHQLYSKLP